MNYGNQAELVAYLGELDKLLKKQGAARKAAVYVFGGAAAVIGYGAPRATVDLDVFLEDQGIEAKLLEWGGKGSELEKRYGLYVQSANTTLMAIEFPEWRDRSVEILGGKFECLQVKVLSKEDLILSKLGRYADRDREDIKYLAEQAGADPDKLVDYYKSARQYYVGDMRALDATFNVVLREHFDRGPLKFD